MLLLVVLWLKLQLAQPLMILPQCKSSFRRTDAYFAAHESDGAL